MITNKIKYFLASLLAFGMFAIIAININLVTNSVAKSSLSMTKVEALSTEFSFNGDTWNDTDTHWFGSDWKPYLHVCTGYAGSYQFTVCIEGVCVTYSQTYTSTWNGHKITCTNGNGNCVNGTSCIPI